MILADTLDARLPPGSRLVFGELLLTRRHDGLFEARHGDDTAADSGNLECLSSVGELRELAKYDAAGGYRPLKTAPTLKGGWRTETESPQEFLARLDAIYPGVFAAWVAYEAGRIDAVPLRRTLDRQTGMYRLAGTIDDAAAARLRAELCAPGCLRRIVWPIDDTSPPAPVEPTTDSIPLLCLEACTFAVSRARELAKEARARAAS